LPGKANFKKFFPIFTLLVYVCRLAKLFSTFFRLSSPFSGSTIHLISGCNRHEMAFLLLLLLLSVNYLHRSQRNMHTVLAQRCRNFDIGLLAFHPAESMDYSSL